jgi:tyrocidine synthetase-3
MKNMIISEDAAIAATQSLKEKQYWLNKLSGELQKTTFPYDLNKPGKIKPRFNTVKFSFTGDLFSRLMRLSNDSDVRLNMVLTAGLVVLLDKYTGSKDIIVGAPIYKQDIEADFINTVLALRSQLDDNMVFKNLLLQVRETVFEAVENQNYPLELLLNELNLAFSEDEFAWLDIAVLLENIHDKKYLQHVKTNMTFTFLRTGESVDGELEYHSLLYEKQTVERIITHFTRLLQKVVFNLDLKLSEIDILSQEEKKQLLYDFNQTAAWYPKERTIHELFEESVDKTPNSTAIVDEDQGITYKELNERANQLARIIRGKGIKPDTLAAIMVDRAVEMIVGILAILKAGGAYLPIDTDSVDNRIKFVLEDSGVKLLLTKTDFEIKAKFNQESIILDDNEIYHGNKTNLEKMSNPGNLAYMIYTSGTTGKPKGVLLEHRGLVNYICWAAKMYVKGERVNFPLYTSISFDLTITSLFTPLITGNSVLIYGGDDKQLLIEKIIEEDKVGVVKLTPSHLKLIRGKKINRTNIKRFIVGGEELDVQLARDITRTFNGSIEIFNEYGPTETVVGSMIYKFDIEKDNRTSVPIGVPVDNTRVYLLDRNQAPVPIGAIGEIYISGDGAARGYFRDKALTSKKFIANPFVPGERMYRTGDLGLFLEDMNIEFLGRKDQQVKVRGFRVELAEIEIQLLNHNKIAEALVTAKEDKNGDKYLCAYIVSDDEIPGPELREYLSGYLPDYMIPSYFMHIDKIPITPNGKVDRRELPEPEFKSGSEYTAPRNIVEKKFVEIWSDILGIEKELIGIDRHFFEMGGHSLNATIMVSRIHKEFNIKMSLVDMFRNPTIRELSGHIGQLSEDKFSSIQSVEKKDYYLLSSAQKRLYILQQMETQSIAYNLHQMFSLEGECNKERAREAFIKLIGRHETLRTSFEIVKSEPVQRIYDKVELAIEYYNLENQAPPIMDKTQVTLGQELEKQVITDFVRPFDLSKSPLMRVGLIRLMEDRHLLLVDMHHIISDGISNEILENDFIALYPGEELPSLRLQYKDYAEWQDQRHRTGNQAVKGQEDYWLKQFPGEIPVLNLPTDYQRPPVQSFEGNNITFEIDKTETNAIKQLVSDEETTLYVVLLAIFYVLLSKISCQEDIIVGTDIAGRRHLDLESIIGMFVNTLALRNYPAGKKTFTQFLREAKERTLEAFENQDYQFEDLVDKVAVKRDTSRNPLFDVMFAFNDFTGRSAAPGRRSPDLAFSHYKSETSTSIFDLILLAADLVESISLTFEYCTKLLKKETIERFFKYFQEIVIIVLDNRDIHLEDINISHDFVDLNSNIFQEDMEEF